MNRIFNKDTGHAEAFDEDTLNWLVHNQAIVFYQTIIFGVGDAVDYYVLSDDMRAGQLPDTDDRSGGRG